MPQMKNGMKIYTSKQLVAALKEAGFTEIKTYSNAKNHWISIVATKQPNLEFTGIDTLLERNQEQDENIDFSMDYNTFCR